MKLGDSVVWKSQAGGYVKAKERAQVAEKETVCELLYCC